MATHYTATLNVSKVEVTPGTGRGDDRKVDREVVKLVIRDKTIEGLVKKMAQHVALIEDTE